MKQMSINNIPVSFEEAAKILLKKAYVKADSSELSRACKRLCDDGFCEFAESETSPVVTT
jgi:hypothetical protein